MRKSVKLTILALIKKTMTLCVDPQITLKQFTSFLWKGIELGRMVSDRWAGNKDFINIKVSISKTPL